MLYRIGGNQNPDRQADVLFVHGLGGDAFGTWRHGKGDSTSWPHWLASEFPTVGVWSLGYAASPTKWLRFWPWGSRNAGHAMPLPDRAGQVLDETVQHGFGQRPILFVCHSLGGLLVKQILRAAAEDENAPERCAVYEKTRAILFLATPHAGAELASLVNVFHMAFGATVSIEDLRAHDAHLAELYDWYRNHAGRIETRTYFETRPVKGMLQIVDRTSAHPGVGANPIALDEDHLSIAKPHSPEDQVCGAARVLLRDYVLSAQASGAVVSNKDQTKDNAERPLIQLASLRQVREFDPVYAAIKGKVSSPVAVGSNALPMAKRGRPMWLATAAAVTLAMVAGAIALMGPHWSARQQQAVAADRPATIRAFEEGCDVEGIEDACYALATLYSQGAKGLPADKARASALYRKALELRSQEEVLRQARLDRSALRDVALYEKACDAGMPSACYWLGRLCDQGQGVPQDKARAAMLYKKACDAGVKRACYHVWAAQLAAPETRPPSK